MKQLERLWQKKTLKVIGLMSGTSADGMDAALTEITGFGLATRVKTLAFVSVPYADGVRAEILRLARDRARGALDNAAPAPEKLPMQVVFDARREVLDLHMAPALERYLVDLVLASRDPSRYDAGLGRRIAWGASPPRRCTMPW